MEKIQKRVNALKNIQLEIDQAEAKLNEEIIQLECKHAPIFDALYKKRETIVSGEREPTEDEAKWEYENGVGEKENGEAKEKVDTSKPGISGFWLRVLDSARLTRSIINDDDKPILKHLKTIKLKSNTEKPYGFTLEFHFEDNEYFTNKVLTKTYEFRSEKDKQNPLLSNNNSLYKCLGCKINWNEGKCPLKDDDEDDEGKQGSFFDFFLTHTSDGVRPAFKETTKGDKKNGGADDDLETDEEAEHLFELDYEIGKFIKDMLIPKAVLYYTGEMQESEEDELDFDSGDEDDDDDNEDDDDDDESEEEDTKPTKKKVKTK